MRVKSVGATVLLGILVAAVGAAWFVVAAAHRERAASSRPASAAPRSRQAQGALVGALLDPARPDRVGTLPLATSALSFDGSDRLVPRPFRGERPARPDPVRGIYLTGWVAGLSGRMNALLRLVDETPLNTMVIDVKDDEGTLTYRMTLPPGVGPGLKSSVKVADIDALLKTLRGHGVYTVARIVSFKDQVLPKSRPDLAVLRPDGSVFRDRAGFKWANPYSRQVWEYNVAVAKDAASRGFNEIQFDYVRFPDVPKSLTLVFPGQDDRSKAEVIRDYLAYARRELLPYGVKVSADIFGLVTTVKDDMGIGQNLEAVASVVDYVSPMAYPSHYARGEFGLANPNAQPYQTVYLSLRDAVRRLKAAGLDAGLVPWLQDFSLGYPYGPGEVLAQVNAAAELGIRDWYLWNPANRYTEAALRRLAQ